MNNNNNNAISGQQNEVRHFQACSMRPRSGKEYTSVELSSNSNDDQIYKCSDPMTINGNLSNKKIYLNDLKDSNSYNKHNSKLVSLYNKERDIAYAAMTRVNDGSIKLDDDNTSMSKTSDAGEQRCSSPPLPFKYNKPFFKDKSLSNISNTKRKLLSPHNKGSVDYIILDFDDTSASQSNLNKNSVVKFDSKVDYACIDFAKTKAIKETGEEHSKDRTLTSLSVDFNSSTNLDQNIFFSNNSTNFYVPISPELLDKIKCKTFEKQRKSSLDLLDSNRKCSLPRHSNTLPHNTKRNIE